MKKNNKNYKARILLQLYVSRCQTYVIFDTDTYNYIELYDIFFLIISCVVSAVVSILHIIKAITITIEL